MEAAVLPVGVGDATGSDPGSGGGARTKRMIVHFAAIGGGVGVTMVANLILVPVLYRHLGPDAFGLWALFISIQVLLGAADLGNSIIYQLTKTFTVGDSRRTACLISASMVATLGAGIVLGVTVGLTSLFVDWASVWNVKGALASDARVATLVLFVTIALGMPASLADKLNLARQLGGRNGAIHATTALLALAAALVVVRLDGNLPWVVAATTLPNVIVRVAWLLAILKNDPRVRPGRSLGGSLRPLLRASAAFTILQVCTVISYNTDQFIVARILGPAAVADYAIPAKMYAILLAVCGATTAALWPAFLEATARHDVRWIRTQTRHAVVWASGFGALFGAAMMVVGPRVLSGWVGAGYQPDRSLLLAFSCLGLIAFVTSVLSFILLSLGSLRPVVILAVFNAIINVGISIALTRRIGVSGAVWGSVFSYLVVMGLPLCGLVRREINRLGVGEEVL